MKTTAPSAVLAGLHLEDKGRFAGLTLCIQEDGRSVPIAAMSYWDHGKVIGNTATPEATVKRRARELLTAGKNHAAHEAIATEAQNLVEFIESALRGTIHHETAEHYALKMRALLSTLTT